MFQTVIIKADRPHSRRREKMLRKQGRRDLMVSRTYELSLLEQGEWAREEKERHVFAERRVYVPVQRQEAEGRGWSPGPVLGAGGRNHLTNQEASAATSVFWKGGPRDTLGRRRAG